MKKLWSIILGLLIVVLFIILLFNLDSLSSLINDLTLKEEPDRTVYEIEEEEVQEELEDEESINEEEINIEE